MQEFIEFEVPLASMFNRHGAPARPGIDAGTISVVHNSRREADLYHRCLSTTSINATEACAMSSPHEHPSVRHPQETSDALPFPTTPTLDDTNRSILVRFDAECRS